MERPLCDYVRARSSVQPRAGLLAWRVAVWCTGTLGSGPGLREISFFLELETVPDTTADRERLRKGLHSNGSLQ